MRILMRIKLFYSKKRMILHQACHLVFILILLSFTTNAYSQRVQKVTATYTYYAPENVSLEEAKRTALERAKLTSIADEFGTIVTQNNSIILNNDNSKSNSHFFSLVGSEVKGEWLETTKGPTYDIRYDGGELIVSVEVKGRIRELINADIDYTAKILRNGLSEKFESSEFRSGDDLYLYFKSPISGYLTVFLLDETLMEVYCLLPYKSEEAGAYKIEHDTPYTFFSAKNDKINPSGVDEYVLTCTRDIEYNDIYIIFSPNSFTKANTIDADDVLLPRQISYEGFQKWLTKLRTRDKDASVLKKPIKILKR